VTISQAIEVPGTILEPGKYVFKLVDSPSDRNIVRIMNERENHVFTTTFAIPKWRQDTPDQTILTFYETPAGQPPALRAWFYPGDNTGREFVYSKDRADVLAKASQTQSVLTAQAAPLQPASTEAEQPDAVSTPAPAPPAQPSDADVDSDHDATPSPSVAEEPEPTPEPAPSAEPAPAEPQDSAASKPAEMPKTASELPLLAGVGLLALAGAAGVRFARTSR
jgi:hypothetical protein